MRSIFHAVILLLCLATVSQAARLDTSFVFATIETPNFSVHYHQGLESVARKAAVFAEEAHDRLVKEFLWQPAEKTQLVLIDDTDFTNGFATALPYNTVFIQTVPPSLASTLGEYDDWLKVLITHEYAHIVTLDSTRGYWNVTRAIFGKPIPGADPVTELLFLVTAPPNSFLPRWWHEGMAVWSETEFTGQGRGRSSFYDMVFRMAVADNNLPYVDQVNGDVPNWPDGNLPYLYGYRLQRYITDTYGKEALGNLSRGHAGRFPYLIGTPAQKVSGGKSYRELYSDMIADLKAQESRNIAVLAKVPFTPLATISSQGERLSNPRFSPDGSRIAFAKRDPHEHPSTVITDSTGSTVVAQFRRQSSDGSICWSPDGASLFFTQAEIVRGFNIYQDLYQYDLARDAITRLTRGQRLGDVDLSPDGRMFAAVVSHRGSQNLALIERSKPGLAAPRMVTDYAQQRVSSPRWSPDGATICYALTDNAGHTALHIHEVASGMDRTLFAADHTAAFPVWSRDGSYLVYVSDETGVFNLFAFDPKLGKSFQVSHLLGGALQPDLSPDGKAIVFSSYDSRGFRIARMPLDRATWLAGRGPSLPLTRAVPAPLPAAVSATELYAGSLSSSGQTPSVPSVPSAPVPVPAAAPSAPPLEEQLTSAGYAGGGVSAGKEAALALPAPYRSLPTLLPHFWLPRISGDGSNQAVLGAYTAGADVLGYQSYALSADYSPGRERGYFNLIYNNDFWYPTLSLKAHAEPFLYGNLLQRGDYYELNQGFTLQGSVPVNFLESRYRFLAGYQFQDQRALSTLDGNGRFRGVSVFQGRRDNIFAGIGFDNVQKYPYSISSEQGRDISFLYRRFDRNLGSDQDLAEYSASYREFLSLPGAALRHHVVYLRLSGAVADGNLRFGQQAFQIGGIPSDLNPYPLRGYAERSVTGKYVATGTLEYRAPLFYPLRGYGTLPAFAEKLHGALFVDAGEVWDDRNAFKTDDVKVGAGFEARLDVTLGYWLKVTPALGFAHGFGSGGENQLYLTVYLDL